MSWNPFSQNSNKISGTPYIAGEYEKAKSRKKLLIAVCILAFVSIGIATFYFSQPDKYTRSATAAARKQTPDAEVSNVKVAGGFAVARVRSPSSTGQANAGNTTIFRVNADESMTQIANGSYFSPLDLLGLGIPLTTQAKLKEVSVDKVKKDLASTCNYSGGIIPGFSGFDGSFDPDGWQIDSTTLSGLEQALADTISTVNAETKPDKATICVNASRKNSNVTTDKKTYISIFTLKVQFITRDGKLTAHTVTFAVGPKHYRNYTLDGHTI